MADSAVQRPFTVVELASGPVTITAEDAAHIAAALKVYLNNGPNLLREALLQEIELAEGWIDDGGLIRVGPWVHKVLDGRLALTQRPPPGPVFGSALLIAWVVRDDHAKWTVGSIDIRRIVPVRPPP